MIVTCKRADLSVLSLSEDVNHRYPYGVLKQFFTDYKLDEIKLTLINQAGNGRLAKVVSINRVEKQIQQSLKYDRIIEVIEAAFLLVEQVEKEGVLLVE